MDWLGAAIDGPLVTIRALHFAATAMTAGALIFRAAVAEPALRSSPVATTVVRSQILLTAWIGLAVAAASGVIWFQLQTVSMSGLPFGEAMTSDVLSTVLNETQFGLVSKVRFVVAVILAACLAYEQPTCCISLRRPPGSEVLFRLRFCSPRRNVIGLLHGRRWRGTAR